MMAPRPAENTMDRSGPARLLIVDDHDLARFGLRNLLYEEPSLEVVGEAKDGLEAVELCRRLRPDLILMDVRMPRMDGLETTRRIKEDHPGISVLMLTMHDSPEYLFDALKAGAAGYVLKDATYDELIAAIQGVLYGESTLAPELAAGLLRRLTEEVDSDEAPLHENGERGVSPIEPLTSRELEVLQLVSLGLTDSEVARSLTISVGAVKSHVQHTIAKLGVSDRTQAAVRAVQMRLVVPAS